MIYLRVDHCEDDKLILTLIDTAQRLVMDVGRMTEKQLAENEETSRQAMLYTVSYLYENRNTADYHAINEHSNNKFVKIHKNNQAIFCKRADLSPPLAA